jgi:5-formyltetrahydrofolate cyclo-ligase
MSTKPPVDAKARLRESMRSRLDAVDGARALEAGEAIAERLMEWSEWQRASAIALFSMVRGEVDTSALARAARGAGKRLLFPRMVAGRTLEFAAIETPHSLRIGRHGVLEPDERCRAEAIRDDVLVLVQGLAFDRQGGRLGRGAGYYDRALGGVRIESGRPLFVGVGFSFQIVDSVPMAALDVRMDGVVTETALFRQA